MRTYSYACRWQADRALSRSLVCAASHLLHMTEPSHKHAKEVWAPHVSYRTRALSCVGSSTRLSLLNTRWELFHTSAYCSPSSAHFCKPPHTQYQKQDDTKMRPTEVLPPRALLVTNPCAPIGWSGASRSILKPGGVAQRKHL